MSSPLAPVPNHSGHSAPSSSYRALPKPKRGSGSATPAFTPSFLTALHEDPFSPTLDGWVVDGDECTGLTKTMEDDRIIVLVLGDPSLSSLNLLSAQLHSNTLLLLPPLTALSSIPSISKTRLKSTRHLKSSLSSPIAIGQLLTEAAEHAVKWKTVSRKPSGRLSGMLSSSSPSKHDGAPSSSSCPGSPSSKSKPFSRETDRMLDVILYFVPCPAPSSSTPLSSSPISLNSPLNPARPLKDILSTSFLVTTACMNLLSPSSTQHTASQTLPPRVTSSTPSSRSRSASLLGNSARSPLNPLDGRPRSGSFLSSSEASSVSSMFAGGLGGSFPRMGMLVHVLPGSMQGTQEPHLAVLPHLLDKFQMKFLSKNLGVTLVNLPEAILGDAPLWAGGRRASDGGRGRQMSYDVEMGEETEGVDSAKEKGSSSPSLPSSSASSSSARTRSPPNVLHLLLTSSLKPPLPILSSRSPSSRRGSSSSLSSRFSFQSLSGPPASEINSYLPSADAILFIPPSSNSVSVGESSPPPLPPPTLEATDTVCSPVLAPALPVVKVRPPSSVFGNGEETAHAMGVGKKGWLGKFWGSVRKKGIVT